MKTELIFVFVFFYTFCIFAQKNNTFNGEVNLFEFGIDSLYNEQLRIKTKQGKLSDCEFAKKNAHNKHGFDILKKTSTKVDSLLKTDPIYVFYQANSCVPDLIYGAKKIYIQDSCIEDTLKIKYRVEVTFEHSLIDTIKPMAVKSVNLIEMDIRSLNTPNIIISLSRLTPIESPLQQYIWDLCSAKFAYWYRFQPYNKLPSGERIKKGNTLYMGAIIWLVPES